MEPTGSPFRRPPPRPSFAGRRGFGPVRLRSGPAARDRPAAGPGQSRARARFLRAAALYAVAALALAAGALWLTGHHPGIIIGLGMARLIDRLVAGAGSGGAVAALADAVLAGGFALLGGVAHRGRLWAFGAGAGLYALDGLIVLAAHDWVGVVIHTAVLVMIVRGLDAARRP